MHSIRHKAGGLCREQPQDVRAGRGIVMVRDGASRMLTMRFPMWETSPHHRPHPEEAACGRLEGWPQARERAPGAFARKAGVLLRVVNVHPVKSLPLNKSMRFVGVMAMSCAKAFAESRTPRANAAKKVFILSRCANHGFNGST